MKIAVLSGKGGTGKTLVSVNLAYVSNPSVYVDCDVEEPNGALYFKPVEMMREAIQVKIPRVNHDKCTGCRTCVDFCKFNALAFINQKIKVFDAICHSCGGCSLVCPVNAIDEVEHGIGAIEVGYAEQVKVMTGRMHIGEETGVPIIKNLLEKIADEDQTTIIDCPPGSSCMVMESIKDADYCILVAEPTQFGTHNLKMVHELVQLFDKPFGCVLNKCLDDADPSELYCDENNIEILGRIPFDDHLGTMNSNGVIISKVDAKYKALFQSLLNRIKEDRSI